MKDQNKEYLFRALGEVGSDLVNMAEKRTAFPNRWRRWGTIAAGLVLVVCLTTLALPYFPKGCGASSESDAGSYARSGDQNEAPAEAADAAGMSEETEEDAIEGADMPAAYGAEPLRFAVDGAVYELQSDAPIPLETPPEDLGSVQGVVSASDWEELLGCTVYAAADGAVYVETAEGYYAALPGPEDAD